MNIRGLMNWYHDNGGTGDIHVQVKGLELLVGEKPLILSIDSVELDSEEDIVLVVELQHDGK